MSPSLKGVRLPAYFSWACAEVGARVRTSQWLSCRGQGTLLGLLNHPPGSGHAEHTQECKPFFLLPSLCLKSQMVDLKAEGYWEELLDTFRPDIVVKDW